jgi:hypothetical protein
MFKNETVENLFIWCHRFRFPLPSSIVRPSVVYEETVANKCSADAGVVGTLLSVQ